MAVLLCMSSCVTRLAADVNQKTCRVDSLAVALDKRVVPTSLPMPLERRDTLSAAPLSPRNQQLAALNRASGVPIGIIRLSDDGDFVDRCESRDALALLRYSSKPYIAVTFIHGWQHNATANDSNLREFRKTLALIQQNEDKLLTGNQVIGVYIAWNGRVNKGPVWEFFSFWGREKAADRIIQSNTVTKLIGGIEHITKMRGVQNGDKDRTVYIGHSFGGRILFGATSQLMTYNTQLAYPEAPSSSNLGNRYSRFDGVGDLVVLINPAFEASKFSGFDALRRKTEQFASTQTPVFLCLSAENDFPTGFAFPAGHALRFRNRIQRTTTLGNYDNYVTHTLKSVPKPDSTRPNDLSNLHHFTVGTVCLDSITDGQHVHYRYRNGRPYLKRNLTHDKINVQWHDHNPFIVARASKDVIDNHGGIWQDNFRNWLVEYVGAIVNEQRKHLAAKH